MVARRLSLALAAAVNLEFRAESPLKTAGFATKGAAFGHRHKPRHGERRRFVLL